MPLSIDKVYYISLDSRIDKHYSQLFAMSHFGVPYDRIERFQPRLSSEELSNLSHVDIVKMIIEDGLSGCRRILNDPNFVNSRHVRDNPPGWASMWSKLSLLREIFDRGETALFLSDTMYLKPVYELDVYDFACLEWFCSRLADEEKSEFKFLNLKPEFPRFSLRDGGIGFTRVKGVFYPSATSGLLACVVTPAAAFEILDYWFHNFDHLYHVIVNMYDDGIDLSGYYFFEEPLVNSVRRYAGEDVPPESVYPFFKVDKVLTAYSESDNHDAFVDAGLDRKSYSDYLPK